MIHTLTHVLTCLLGQGNEPVHRVYGNYEYYSVQSGNYPLWVRQHVGQPELGEQRVLDENKLAAHLGVPKVRRDDVGSISV